MANLTRYLQKIFAGNSNQIGVFGTGVNKETSTNVETLQSAAYASGWSSAIITNKNYPIWQERDGVDYGFSYQLAYLLQKGIPDWIATETYYTNDYCKLGSDIYYSLQDNNIGQNPAGTTGYWKLASGADTDLSNLTTAGNARLQYAPFAINNGTVTDGENATLYCPTSPSIIDASWTQPTLASNGTIGSSDVAVSDAVSGSSSAYATFNGTSNLVASNWANIDFRIYVDEGIDVSAIGLKNGGMYATTGGVFYVSDNGSDWTEIGSFSQALSDSNYSDFNVSVTGYHKYYRILLNSAYSYGNGNRHVSCGGIRLTASHEETIATGTDLISAPCTITTCDGRTKNFDASSIIDCSSQADGTYKVLKDYSTGALSLVDNFNISQTVPIGQSLTNNLIPLMTSNTEPYGTTALESGSLYENHQAWQFFAGSSTYTEPSSASSSVSYTFTEEQEADKYQTYFEYAQDASAYGSRALNSYSITLYYTDNTSEVIVNKNTGSPSWSYSLTDTFVASKPFNKITIGFSGTIYSSTIGLLRNFKLKRYVASTGDYWLDTSVIPANFKIYNGSSWDINNNRVYIGDVTVESNVIIAVSNRQFNDSGYAINKYYLGEDTPHIVSSYVNGMSGYNIWSNKYCEQWGIVTSSSQTTVYLLKAYADTNYIILSGLIGNTKDYTPAFQSKTASSFVGGSTGSGYTWYWATKGYIA